MITSFMSDTLYALIKLLADGHFHSGEALGRALGISRAAVWKSLQLLPELGLELHAVNGRGYRLAEPLELLDKNLLLSLNKSDLQSSRYPGGKTRSGRI